MVQMDEILRALLRRISDQGKHGPLLVSPSRDARAQHVV